MVRDDVAAGNSPRKRHRMRPDLVLGLQTLDRDELRTSLGNDLSLTQIDALIERRDRLLVACRSSD